MCLMFVWFQIKMDEKLVKKSKESRIKKNSTHLYLQDKHLEKIVSAFEELY